MRTVLVVSPHFPPVNTADCHRVRLTLPFLRDFGWKAEVVAVEPNCIASPIDPWLSRGIPAEIPIHRVKALGLGWSRVPGLGSLDFRASRALDQCGQTLLATGKFDLIYFSTTVFGVHILGPRWKKRYSVDYVMDYQDPWVTDIYRQHPNMVPPGGRVKYAIIDFLNRRQEPRVLRDCSGITSVSPAYPEDLKSRYPWLKPLPCAVIPFPGSSRDFERIRKEQSCQNVFDANDGNRHWLYVGRGGDDMHASLKGLFIALKSWKTRNPKEYQRTRLHFIGTSYAKKGKGTETILPLAEQIGVDDIVIESTNRIPYSDTLNCLDHADGLLVIGSLDPAYTASKLYPYLLARKPLLAIFRRESPAVEILNIVGGGQLATFDADTTSEQLAAEISAKWFENEAYDKLRPMDEPAFEPYTDRGSARQLCEFFDRIVTRQF